MASTPPLSQLKRPAETAGASIAASEPKSKKVCTQRPDERSKAFRVCDIPGQYDGQALKALLRRLLTLDDIDNGLSVRSLAIDATKPETKVATIDFEHVPVILSKSSSSGASLCCFKVVDDDDLGVSTLHYLSIDTAFLGLTTFASPSSENHTVEYDVESVFKDINVDIRSIIALPGLGGHAFGSFKQRGGDYMWLRDALPRNLDGARVMTYGYESHLHLSNSFQDLEALGRTFCGDLQTIRERTVIPKIFIGHSLGGLVIKQAMIYMGRMEEHRDILNATRGVLFFGTPNLGMDIESLVPMVRGQPNELFLHTIGPESQLLREQCEQFPKVLQRDLSIFCFYETKRSATAVKDPHGTWKMSGPEKTLVSSESARHGRDRETGSNVEPLNKDHSNMVKFDPNDQAYYRVRDRLRKLTDLSRRSHFPTRSITNIEQECLHSLSFPEMNSRRNDILKAMDRTCEWIFDHPRFKTWASGETGLLWIKGNPGSGKSTLLKHILWRLQETHRHRPRHLIFSFLCHGRGTELERTPSGLFRSLSHQLLSLMPDTFSALVALYDQRKKQIGKFGKKWAWHVAEVQDHFEQALAETLRTSSVQIMIDALDECGEDNACDLVKVFQRLTSCLRSKDLDFSICFTCRHYPILKLDDGAEICTEHQNQDDIEIFVEKELSELPLALESVPKVRAKICERAQGVFQWAAMVIGEVFAFLRKGKNTKAILSMIEAIPPELATLYEGLFNSLETDERAEALRLMRWICYATRPLTLGELRYAVVFQTNDPPRSIKMCRERPDFAENDQLMRTQLTHLSRGLAEARQSYRGMVAQFIHQSVQDFFTERGLKILLGDSAQSVGCAEWNTHYILSLTCLRCISLDDPTVAGAGEDWDGVGLGPYHRHLLLEVPFIEYATTSLLDHLHQAQREQHMQQALSNSTYDISPLGSALENCLRTWILLYRNFKGYGPAMESTLLHIISYSGLPSLLPDRSLVHFEDMLNSRNADGQTPLIVAASRERDALVKLLLDTEKVDVDARDNNSHTLLLWAVKYGRAAVVKLLLDTEKVDVEARDYNGDTPLLWAVDHGRNTVVKLLLDTEKVDVDARDYRDRTPLLRAASGERDTVVKLLLDTEKVDVDARDYRGQTPLLWAALLRRDAVVKLLLETENVDVDARDHRGRTPLLRAAGRGYDAVVKLLLDTKKVDVNSRDTFGKTPLLNAAGCGHDAVVKLLLDTGVDIDAKDDNGRMPLSWAAGRGHEAVVKLLLDTGVDIDAKDDNGRTPLSWAADRGHEAVVKLLLETENVDVDARDHRGRTPLLRAAGRGYDAVVKLLLDTGEVDVDTRDAFGQTPLLYAAIYGSDAVVKLLLNTGKVDVDTVDNYSQTPLSLAAHRGNDAVVKLLLDTGEVDINAKDAQGQTPLLNAAGRGHDAVVKLLLDTEKLEVNARDDDDSRMLLSWAASRGSDALIKILLDTGQVDVDAKDGHGQTPLLLAAKNGSDAVVKLLLDTGQVDVDAKDGHGQKPLFWAAMYGNDAVVKLLLDTGEVDINAKNDDGQTPLSMAESMRHATIVNILLDAGGQTER